MLTHLNEQGEANMVDVGAKDVTVRTAKAAGRIRMQKETLQALLNASLKKTRGKRSLRVYPFFYIARLRQCKCVVTGVSQKTFFFS